jgi:hypothetical protein
MKMSMKQIVELIRELDAIMNSCDDTAIIDSLGDAIEEMQWWLMMNTSYSHQCM